MENILIYALDIYSNNCIMYTGIRKIDSVIVTFFPDHQVSF